MRFTDDFKLDMQVLDVQNTLAGGCAAPYIKLQKEDGFWMVYAKIPGLKENRFDVELDKRNLRINYKLEMPNVGNLEDGQIRLMAGYMELPSEVNMQAIEAEFEDGLLKIIMPIDAYLDGDLENPLSGN